MKFDDAASFLVNRLLARYINEAIFCLEEGLASVEGQLRELFAIATELAGPASDVVITLPYAAKLDSSRTARDPPENRPESATTKLPRAWLIIR